MARLTTLQIISLQCLFLIYIYIYIYIYISQRLLTENFP